MNARTAALLAVAAGAVLRLYPCHVPYVGLELQEHYPRNAVVALVQGDWAPFGLHHGSGLLYVLRALYTAGYASARVFGIVESRMDVLAAFVRDPFPFVLVGRAVVLTASIASCWMAARIAERLAGGGAAVISAVVCATAYVHVRESHMVWLDVPSGALALLTTLLALRAFERPTLGPLALTALAGGATVATKHSAAPIMLTVVAAALLQRGPRVITRLAVAAVCGAAAYVVLSPYTLLRLNDVLAVMRRQSAITYAPVRYGLALPAMLALSFGLLVPVLAAAGVAFAFRRDWRRAGIAAAFPVAYLAMLVPATNLYNRYLATLAPFVAVFAGVGTMRLATLISPRHRAPIAALATIVAVASPLAESLAYVRVLARDDTRVLAGRWLRDHVSTGTPIVLPNLTTYPNPIVPMNEQMIRLVYPQWADALRDRGLGDPGATWPATYLKFFGKTAGGASALGRWVITADHPAVMREMGTDPAVTAALAAAGAEPVARFLGVVEPVPDGVRFDPLEADYIPLRGATAITRPGPNIVVWRMPAPATGNPAASPLESPPS